MNEEQIIAFLNKENPTSSHDAHYRLKGRVTRDVLRPIYNKWKINKLAGKITSSDEVEKLKKRLAEYEEVKENLSTFTIEPREPSDGMTEAVVVVVASDWHVEERVEKEWVLNLNEHNLEISKARAEQFFQNALRLTQIVQRDINVKTMVLALLGDFITNDIHPENSEINILLPKEATQQAQSYIASGIQFLLDNSDLEFIIPCSSGNHARTTKLPYKSTEHGHSWEHFMYDTLRWHFEKEPRVKFIVNNSYHTIVDVLGYKIRFHHGHEVKYQGGVGGLYIPANKKIAQWNKAIKVDLDVFGHHHSFKDGGSFISNGSQIGYNPYAMRGGFDFEKPKQAFFVIDKKRGKTWVAPILYSV